MGFAMMLTYCEAPYGEYDEVMRDVRARINAIPNEMLMEALESGLLDDNYNSYELKEKDLFDVDNVLLLYLRHQIVIAADLVFLAIDNSFEVSIHYFEDKRMMFSGGLSCGDFPTDIFQYITIVDGFDLFSGMGNRDYKYPA